MVTEHCSQILVTLHKGMHRTSVILLMLLSGVISAQPLRFSEHGKWGLREGNKIIAPAKYDTVYTFDKTGKVCLACSKQKTTSNTQYIKITRTSIYCNYISNKGRVLSITNSARDTCSVFSLAKQSLSQYESESELMVVTAKGHAHLVDKNFRQITFEGYHNIEPIKNTGLLICQRKGTAQTILQGVVDLNERLLVPFRYSNIKVNTGDSLIIACSAGIRNGNDEVYDYFGKKLNSSARHIQAATPAYLLQKVFEPEEAFFVLNRHTGKEQQLKADEVLLRTNNQCFFRKKKNWYSYNIITGEKKPIKQPEP